MSYYVVRLGNARRAGRYVVSTEDCEDVESSTSQKRAHRFEGREEAELVAVGIGDARAVKVCAEDEREASDP